MLTFDDARQVVATSTAVRAMYPPDDFEVAEYGWENRDVYVIVAGTHMDVTGEGEVDSLTMDAPARLVDKSTGELREVHGLMGRDPAPDLQPIGPVPEWDDEDDDE
ncbi:hypothetical protein SEA_NERGAL_8 [Mycobacterium Phage Nergal]|nr:hypothetical protein SEA_NERGAL_8 [Mycobacterium Phage Nergal]